VGCAFASLVAPSACQLGDGSNKTACATTADCNEGRICGAAKMCIPGVQALALGFKHTCALRQGATVQCWGDNALGEGGDAPPQVLLPLSPGMRLAPILDGPATAMEAGEGFNCALMATGKIDCWGDNTYGNLGQGPGAASPGTADLATGYTAVQVSVGETSSCAVLAGGAVKCWGDNRYAQLGIGNKINQGDQAGQMGDNLPFVTLGSGHTARAIAVGDAHVCALLDDFQIACWGDNVYGQLGLEDNVTRGDGLNPLRSTTEVTSLGSLNHAVALSAAGDRTCALLDNGQVKCWGVNYYGELGLGVSDGSWGDLPGSMGDNLPSVDLGAGRSALAVAAGEQHTCAILDDRSLKCWGRNDSGQLGLDDGLSRGIKPEDMGDSLPTVDLGTGRTALAVAAGAAHTCALLDNHQVKCWGLNADGELGLTGLDENRGDGAIGAMGIAAKEMGDNLPYVDLGP
jgi:alpha-tubulin suppressor-like RCC1 family protein